MQPELPEPEDLDKWHARLHEHQEHLAKALAKRIDEDIMNELINV